MSVEQFQDIVQMVLAMHPLDYHAFVSALRTHDSAGETYLSNKRNQVENSTFVTYSSPSDPSSSLTYQPRSGGESVAVKPSDRSPTPYSVSIPARAVFTSKIDSSTPIDATFVQTCFHDTPSMTEHTLRHPFTLMDSDVEDEEDVEEKYPEYQPTNIDSLM